MYPPPVDYKFENDSYKFVAVLACVAGVGFIFSVYTKVRHHAASVSLTTKILLGPRVFEMEFLLLVCLDFFWRVHSEYHRRFLGFDHNCGSAGASGCNDRRAVLCSATAPEARRLLHQPTGNQRLWLN